MATKTFEELKQLAIQIRDEKTNKQNTATRVGTAMLEHINKLEQDYYDKTQTDEELKEQNEKLTGLKNRIDTNMPYVLLPYKGSDDMIQIDYPARKLKFTGTSYFIVKNSQPYSSVVSNEATEQVGQYETDFIVPESGYGEDQVWLLAFKVEDKKLYYINYQSIPSQTDERGNISWYPLAYCNFVSGEFHTNFQGTLYYNGRRYTNTKDEKGNLGGWIMMCQNGKLRVLSDLKTLRLPNSITMFNVTKSKVIQIYFDKDEDSPIWENSYEARHYLKSERDILLSPKPDVISGLYFREYSSYNDDYKSSPFIKMPYDGSHWDSILPGKSQYGNYTLIGLYRFGFFTTSINVIQYDVPKHNEPFSASFYGNDPKSTINIDTVNNKVTCRNGNRMFLTNNFGTHLDIYFNDDNDNLQTDILLNTPESTTFYKEQLWYLYYTADDKKVYLVNYNRLNEFFGEGSTHTRDYSYLLGAGTFESGARTFEARLPFTLNGVQYYSTNKNVNESIKEVPISNFPFIDTFYTDNLFDKDSAKLNGYWGTTGNTWTPSSEYGVSDFIPVVEGQEYKSANMLTSGFVYPYDEDKNPILMSDGKYYWQPLSSKFIIPEGKGIRYISVIFSMLDNVNKIMFGLSSADFSSYIPFIIRKIRDEYLPSTLSDYNSKTYGKSNVGNLQYEEIGETDYNQIILYGQSLSMGWEAPEVITKEAIEGNYMVGTLPLMYGDNMNPSDFNSLIAVKWSNGGEQPIVGCTNSFSKLYRRFVNKNQLFIGSNVGEGGRSIERLSKDCTNGENYYTTRFLKLLDSTKSIADGKGKTVNCSAILYMQGEYNYTNLSGAGLTPGTDATNDKDTYKALLLRLKNDMQADIMEKYGQKNKPLFFIYEVAGGYINNKEMSINMAQIEFAQENDDVFLLHPTYSTPDYGGGHLSTNGYRWYGEMMAKSLYDVFIKGEDCKPVFPMEYTVYENKLIIDFYVPVPPLVFDTWTKETITNMGFRVYNDGTEVTINSVEIEGNSVVITCASNLSGTVEVTYAGQGRSGSGNLRDSDTFHSYYTYFDDRETSLSKRENYTPKDKQGNFIYGKSYPMYNWCANFYYKVE